MRREALHRHQPNQSRPVSTLLDVDDARSMTGRAQHDRLTDRRHRPGRTGRVAAVCAADRCIVLDVDGTLVDGLTCSSGKKWAELESHEAGTGYAVPARPKAVDALESTAVSPIAPTGYVNSGSHPPRYFPGPDGAGAQRGPEAGVGAPQPGRAVKAREASRAFVES